MKKIKYIKLDMDDILEILLEHYQEKFKNCENSKGILLGSSNEELRFVGAFSYIGDKRMESIDLKKVDKEMDYNGEHSFLKKNPQFFIK